MSDIQDKYQQILINLLKDDDNKYCADCDAKGPRWASWNLGFFICIRCAGIHRNLGVHISKVKSVNLDSWNESQVAMMQYMGNTKSRIIYEHDMPESLRRPQTDSSLETFIRNKYEHKIYIGNEKIPPAPTKLKKPKNKAATPEPIRKSSNQNKDKGFKPIRNREPTKSSARLKPLVAPMVDPFGFDLQAGGNTSQNVHIGKNVTESVTLRPSDDLFGEYVSQPLFTGPPSSESGSAPLPQSNSPDPFTSQTPSHKDQIMSLFNHSASAPNLQSSFQQNYQQPPSLGQNIHQQIKNISPLSQQQLASQPNGQQLSQPPPQLAMIQTNSASLSSKSRQLLYQSQFQVIPSTKPIPPVLTNIPDRFMEEYRQNQKKVVTPSPKNSPLSSNMPSGYIGDPNSRPNQSSGFQSGYQTNSCPGLFPDFGGQSNQPFYNESSMQPPTSGQNMQQLFMPNSNGQLSAGPMGMNPGGPPMGMNPGGPPMGMNPGGPPMGMNLAGCPPMGMNPGGPPMGMNHPGGPPMGMNPGGPPMGMNQGSTMGMNQGGTMGMNQGGTMGMNMSSGTSMGMNSSNGPPMGMHPSNCQPMGMHPSNCQPMGMHPSNGPQMGMHPSNCQPMGMHPSNGPPMGMHPSNGPPMGMNSSNGPPMGRNPSQYSQNQAYSSSQPDLQNGQNFNNMMNDFNQVNLNDRPQMNHGNTLNQDLW